MELSEMVGLALWIWSVCRWHEDDFDLRASGSHRYLAGMEMISICGGCCTTNEDVLDGTSRVITIGNS